MCSVRHTVGIDLHLATVSGFTVLKIRAVGKEVGEAVGKAVMLGDDAKGHTYHLAGDDVFTTEEIVEFVLESIQTDVQKLYISPERAEAMGMFYEQIWDPKCTRDSLRLWQEDCVLNAQYGERTISDLGVKPRSMKREAFNYLIRFRKGGHFIEL